MTQHNNCWKLSLGLLPLCTGLIVSIPQAGARLSASLPLALQPNVVASARHVAKRPQLQRNPRADIPLATITTLTTFIGNNGANPLGLRKDRNNTGSPDFYGITKAGGANGLGTVFRVSSTGALSTLVNFSGTNGANPAGRVCWGQDGNLYGATSKGGTFDKGTLFRLNPNTGALTTLVNFNGTNGSEPIASLMRGNDNNIYGTTSKGGADDKGTVFKLDPTTGMLTTLTSFNGTNGATPLSPLFWNKGSLFGATWIGGTSNKGTIFRVNSTTGALTTLVNLNGTKGEKIGGPLARGADGRLYGTASRGGANDKGTIFRLNVNTGALTTLISFDGTNGANPLTGMSEVGSVFYGTTYGGGLTQCYGGCGTAFKFNPTTGVLTTVAHFNGSNGANPTGVMRGDSDGYLYGTTHKGGSSKKGTVFRLDLAS